MTPLEHLNARLSIPGQLGFRANAEGLVFAEIDNAQATASICLQGGHVVTWQPKTEARPVIWVSSAAKFAPGKSIRGGAPVCWPWFGPHETEAGFPAHGYARTVNWEVTDSRALDSGETELALALVENEQTRAQWPHRSRLEILVTVGRSLKLNLITTNLGDHDFVIGEALHTYFEIGDIAEVRLLGLEGCEYLDKVENFARKRQEGGITFSGETDRVYVNTGAECVIEDAGLRRRIRIAKSGSQSTVVWTPWVEKAEKMGDMGPGTSGQGGWREMVCVESANALDNRVTVPAGQTRRLNVEYSVEPF
ncbi:MAG: D-hexose-6-phosphate mutarotase [Hydrogenophilaceae bacterium]|nr:D-hexose-6-phosphate mutarotase [Hydrogenophilaceae bacterium]